MRVDIEEFGHPDTGGTTDLVRLTNATGAWVAFIPVGARVVELAVPDRDGVLDDVVLGFGSLDDYLGLDTFAGAVAGRYANRIAGASFELDGETVTLEANEGRNHLHGGSDGLDRQHWDYEIDADAGTVTFTHVSPDGHAGYPGELAVRATYGWSDDHRLRLDLTATTTRPTVVNLVHHGYWNLAGHRSGSVLGQTLHLPASAYTPVDAELLTTGELLPVAGTPFDFRTAHPIGDLIGDLPSADGYDHNWVLDGERGVLHLAARLSDPGSGRVLTVSATEPGVQVYTAGYLAGLPGKDGATYGAGAGVAFESQTFPCAPNHPHFPSAVLRPAEVYRHTMVLELTTVP